MQARMRWLALALSTLDVAGAYAIDAAPRAIRPPALAADRLTLPMPAASRKPLHAGRPVAIWTRKLSGASVGAPGVSSASASTTIARTGSNLQVAPGTTAGAHRSQIQLVAGEVEDAPARDDFKPAPEPSSPRGQLTADLLAYPIDLATAWQLADARNPQVAFVRERVWQAYAQQQAADSLWIPTLRAGVTYAEHDGTLQETPGRVIDAHRYSVQTGAGAAAFGAGPPMLPGLSAEFHLADAMFQPLAARRATEARRAASAAATNDMLLDVARGYLNLLRTAAEAGIADESHRNSQHLATLTDSYARTGTGLQADADRMQTETALRHNELIRADEAVWLASSRLVRLLSLDQKTILQPVGSELVPLELVSRDTRLADALETARTWRPELIENQNLLSEAHARVEREKYAPLVPSVSLGMSYGGFGGGGSGSGSHFSDRTDFQALAYWQVRNLGVGDQAARRERLSQVRQACHRHSVLEDQIAQEVGEAYATWRSQARQIEAAERGVRSAKASYDRNLERIRGGQGLPIEVLQAIQALAAARREHTRAIIEFNAAQFALHRATGMCLSDLPTTPPAAPPAPSPSDR